MPQMTHDEIKERIAEDIILAITVDTEVFDQYGCDLDYPLLKKLDQFQDTEITVYISEVVAGEIKRHISAKAGDTQRELKKALREIKRLQVQHKRRWKLTDEAYPPLPNYSLSDNPDVLAEEQFQDYAENVGLKILPASAVPEVGAEVVNRYFATKVPFENKKDKRFEFPDAFALLSLEMEAQNNESMILCVSGDKGWQNFAAASPHLVCVDKLDVALGLFQHLTTESIVDRLVTGLRDGTLPSLQTQIAAKLRERLQEADFDVEAQADDHYEWEPQGITLLNVDFETLSDASVIASDSDSISLAMVVESTAFFEAYFSFHKWDSVDKEYMKMNSKELSTEENITSEIIMTISRRNVTDEPEIIDLDATPSYITVDFGYLEVFDPEDFEPDDYR